MVLLLFISGDICTFNSLLIWLKIVKYAVWKKNFKGGQDTLRVILLETLGNVSQRRIQQLCTGEISVTRFEYYIVFYCLYTHNFWSWLIFSHSRVKRLILIDSLLLLFFFFFLNFPFRKRLFNVLGTLC